MADRGVSEQDFDEYDPTPYGGGYDQVAFYGRPKPPSDETCYPLSARPDCSDDYSHGYGGTKAPYRPAFGGGGGGYVDESRPTFQPDRPSRPSYGEENEGFGSGYGGEAHSGYGRPPVPAYQEGGEEHGGFGSGYGGEVHSSYGRPPVPAYHAGGEEHGSFGSGFGGEVHSGYGRPPVPAYHAEEEYGRGPNPYGRNEEEEGFGGERPHGRPYDHARPPPQEEPYHEEPPKPFGYGEEENRYQSGSHYAHIGRKKSGRSDSDEEEEKKGYGHGRRPHGYGETEEGSGGFQGYSEQDGSRHKHNHWGHHNDD